MEEKYWKEVQGGRKDKNNFKWEQVKNMLLAPGPKIEWKQNRIL